MMYADTNKLTIFTFIETPNAKDKKVTLYTQYNIEDADEARAILDLMREKNSKLKIYAEITSRWNVT